MEEISEASQREAPVFTEQKAGEFLPVSIFSSLKWE
jgi:hypothetical protein